MKKTARLANRYCITNGKNFRLKDIDPADTWHLKSKDNAKELLAQGVEKLCELQERLYAQDKWGVLCIFQAMDAAGKDGTIKHVMSGINPQGCAVTAFKAPTTHELDHDFLWRSMVAVPGRGQIGIFNRSYYEEVLVVRVHPEFLAGQKIPEERIGKRIWEERFEDINAYERYLNRNGVIVRKFFLHVSKAEQKRRFIERLDMKEKNWKFSSADIREREFWGDYMEAYEDMIRNTATKDAPWYVVPADNKWFTRLVVASAIIETLDSLNLQFPKVSETQRQQLAAAREHLVGPKSA